jgi:uncharacterized protein (DUF2336 family)
MTLAQDNLLEQLDAFARQDIHKRADALRRVTDLFMSGAGKFSEEQVGLFDEVMGRLLVELDKSVRVAFGRQLAQVAAAPPRVMRGLALDDAIEVAGPVLSQSEALDEGTLVEGARTKSQDHLLAISRRKMLGEAVTDVLVARGDRTVAVGTAANPGAQFSEFGYSTLVERSRKDGELTLVMWARPEIPRQHLLALFAQASEAVRRTLEATGHARGGVLQGVIAEASNRIQAGLRETSEVYSVAHSRVMALHADGKLGEAQLAQFASSGNFDEATVALSLMADLPIAVIERAIANRSTEQILVLAKAIGLGWETARSVLLMRAATERSLPSEIDGHYETFARLRQDTAKKAMQFYRLREKAATGN